MCIVQKKANLIFTVQCLGAAVIGAPLSTHASVIETLNAMKKQGSMETTKEQDNEDDTSGFLLQLIEVP